MDKTHRVAGSIEAVLHEFTARQFPQGIPFAEARAHARSAGATPVLLSILDDGTKEAQWTNAVLTLGIGGDETAWPKLKAFIQGTDARTAEPVAAYQARSSVLLALGCMLNSLDNERRGSPPSGARREILDFLSNGLRPSFWPENAYWKSPHHEDQTRRNLHLTMLSAQGLGLSGNAAGKGRLIEAAKHISGITSRAGTTELTRPEIMQVSGVLRDSAKVNERVASSSLLAYYRRQN